jgi:aldehyde dehydrogenase (NAD+)
MVTFTGSTQVGREIMAQAASTVKKVHLELGGKSALIVLDDVDVEKAVSVGSFGSFLHQGQICMSANRILVHRSLYSEFLDQYVGRVSKLKVGDPRDSETQLGPLINKAQVETLRKQVEKGSEEGARVVLRGKVEGNLISPTIFADVRPEMSIAQNEMFGPAVCVMAFDSAEEAVQIANQSAFGLSGAIHTRNIELGAELAKQIDSGAIHINDGTINDEPLVAFGGEKASGVGRLNGKWALEEFTTLKWVSVQHKPRHYPFEALQASNLP